MAECYNGNGFAIGNKIDELLEDCSQPTIFAFSGLTSRLAKTLTCSDRSIPGIVAGESTPVLFSVRICSAKEAGRGSNSFGGWSSFDVV